MPEHEIRRAGRLVKHSRAVLTVLVALLLGLALGEAVVASTPLPGGVPIEDLEHTKAWQLEIDGEVSELTEIYYSDYEVAWLLKTPKDGSLLVSPRGMSVQRVAEQAFARKAGTGATLEPLGGHDVVAEFTQSRQVISFELDGRAFALKPAPPILGRRSSLDLGERHPAFEHKAADYRPQAQKRAPPLEKAAAEDVIVRVYFGSWSPICERIVPKIMAVEEAWRHVRFEYYGLPEPLTDDPHAVDLRITGVPTVVILRGGEESERLTGRQLDQPEAALGTALGG